MTRPSAAKVLLWAKYSASSVIAGLISELAFVISYWIGTAPVAASAVAFVAGALPNYVLNRRWAWGRKGRADRRRELLPYAIIVIVTAAAAALTTTAADHWIRARIESHAWQTILVSAVFLGTYGVLFILKFVLFDRFVFAKPAARADDLDAARTPATR